VVNTIELEELNESIHASKKSRKLYETKTISSGKINPIVNPRDMDDIWEKASSERSKFSDRIVVYTSKVIEVENEYKVVMFPFMTDKKGEVYWCYKSEIFSFHHRCMSAVFDKMTKGFPFQMFSNYDEVFKRGDGDTIETPIRLKSPANDPEKVGHKVAFYIHTLPENSIDAVEYLLETFVNALLTMQHHPEYMGICLDKTFAKYGGKFTDVMKNSMLNDKTFNRVISSSNVHCERNIPLYDITTTDGVRFIMNRLFEKNKPPLMTWGYELKTFCFANGSVPKGFAFPK
jgi:hypothetical protein